MKKILTIVSMAVLVFLVACTQEIKSNARAVVSNYSPASQTVSFRVEVRDPDTELETRLFDIIIIDTNGKESKLEDQSIPRNQVKSFDFSDLERSMKYNIKIVGTKNGADFQLAFVNVGFTTLAQGDVEADPLMISTTEQFISMNSKKHYKLANDIDFEGASFTPLFTSGTPFNGTFNGDGKSIKNMNITAADDVYKSYLSIFGYASKSKIMNVIFDNIDINNDAKHYTGISYVGIVVSKISNNEFEIDNVQVKNSSITIKHNINQTTTNRNLYVGLVGGSLQGKLSNVSVSNSTLTVTQGGANGLYAGSDVSTVGTYVGGVAGLMEQDKGFGISKISVESTEITYNLNQDKKGNGTGLVYVGGIFGANRSDRSSSELVSKANITVNHTKNAETELDKSDVIYVGGITGTLQKSNLTNAAYTGNIVIKASHQIKNIYTGLITAYATKASSKLVTSGKITLTTESDAKNTLSTQIYNYEAPGTWNKFQHVKYLNGTLITVDGTNQALTGYEQVSAANLIVDSEYVLSKLN